MIDYKGIINLANSVVEEHETRDPIQILELLNVIMVYEKINARLIAVCLEDPVENFKFFLINEYANFDYIKVYLAHELGHYFMHEGFCLEDYSSMFVKSNSRIKDKEADIFAASLLIDDEEILDLLMNYQYTNSQLASYFGVPEMYIEYKLMCLEKIGKISIHK